jgi:3-dehydroquinate dehydratase/shikimate dehydrogenase
VQKPLFKDRICAVVAAPTARLANSLMRRALKLTNTIELRLDYLRTSREMWFSDVPRASRIGTVIVTCRTKAAGGRFVAKPLAACVSQCLHLSRKLCEGAQWYDLEIETLADAQPGLVPDTLVAAPRRRGLFPRRIVSWHQFRATPRNLPALLRTLRAHGQAAKIATQCNSIRDSLRLLALCKGRRDVIAVPMGEMGLPARVLALKHGSALAYAAVGQKTAPGQLSFQEMKNLYRADRLDRNSRVYGVIGNPVSHSLSPLLHNTAFIARLINDVYLPFLVHDLPDFLAALKPLGIRGFSVTLPFKQKIMRYLDDCDPLAAAIGAVNTVTVRSNGRLLGMNTDYVGVLRALQKRVRLRGARVLIYGAGGAARAVAFALAHEGAVPAICARRRGQARTLARAVHGETLERRHLRNEFFDAIVNCTPVGMHPRPGESPLRAGELNCRLVFDSVYRPMKTRLLQLAERRGIETVSGVEMFLAQGMAQWEIWTGQRAPEKEMRRVVVRALSKEGAR